jgi:transcriptional regulator with XRE-family HTH domain
MRTKKDFETFQIKFGARLKELREEKGITQAEMSLDPYPFERRNWQRIEAGERNITIKTLYQIAEKFGLSPKDLLDF